MVDVPLAPWLMLRLLGEDERANVGAWTARAMLVVAVTLPEVPVMAKVVVAGGAELVAVSVRTLDPEAGFVPQDAVTPVGSPDSARFTLPVKPN